MCWFVFDVVHSVHSRLAEERDDTFEYCAFAFMCVRSIVYDLTFLLCLFIVALW